VSLGDLANLGELIAGVGVVVSLLYLAVQIRESRRIATWNAHLAVSESVAGITADIAKDLDFFRTWRAVLDSPADASDEDRERVAFILHEVFSAFENADRFGDPDLHHRLRSVQAKFLRAPGVQEWWARQRETYSEPFRSKIDARLKELTSATREESGSGTTTV
jgi:hypothetical protein